ncbi:MAG: nucleotide exchange factor GrpE [Dehalococcoidia bacterium]|nr:nucleotide exchange factor GrpE [Dehalococcoidia bacterium]
MMENETQNPSDVPGEADAPRAEAGASAEAGTDTPQELERARDAAQKYLDNWRRAEADLQNYKRRAEQERDESRRFSHAALIINLLPILDDFERAFSSLDMNLAGLTWFDGMRLIYRKLWALLENAGVTPIQSEGQAFDPRYHEAVAHADGEEGKVISEVQRGYKLHDRVLRPAMVVVGKGAGEEEGSGKKEEGDGGQRAEEPGQ